MDSKSHRSNRRLCIQEGSNQIIPPGEGRSSEGLELSNTVASSPKHGGFGKMGWSRMNSFLRMFGRKRHMSEERKNILGKNHHLGTPHSAFSYPHISEILRACTNGGSINKHSMEFAKVLLKGALDLHETLAMVDTMQDVSEYMTKGKLKRIEVEQSDDENNVGTKVARLNEQSLSIQNVAKNPSSSVPTVDRGGIPTVIARLMGLEELPEYRKANKEHKKQHDMQKGLPSKKLEVRSGTHSKMASNKIADDGNFNVLHQNVSYRETFNMEIHESRLASIKGQNRTTEKLMPSKGKEVTTKDPGVSIPRTGASSTTQPCHISRTGFMNHDIVGKSLEGNKPHNKVAAKRSVRRKAYKVSQEKKPEKGKCTSVLEESVLNNGVLTQNKSECSKVSCKRIEVNLIQTRVTTSQLVNGRKSNMHDVNHAKKICLTDARQAKKGSESAEKVIKPNVTKEEGHVNKFRSLSALSESKRVHEKLASASEDKCQNEASVLFNDMQRDESNGTYACHKDNSSTQLKSHNSSNSYTIDHLTEDEIHLKDLLVRSQMFLNTTEALFGLNIAGGVMHMESHECEKEDRSPILDCSYEIMRRKGRRLRLSAYPLTAFRRKCFKKVTSLDELVKQLNKSIEDLQFHAGVGTYEDNIAGNLYNMLEKDIENMDPDVNCMWDMAWTDKDSGIWERDEVIRDLEKYMLNALLDEISSDFLNFESGG